MALRQIERHNNGNFYLSGTYGRINPFSGPRPIGGVAEVPFQVYVHEGDMSSTKRQEIFKRSPTEANAFHELGEAKGSRPLELICRIQYYCIDPAELEAAETAEANLLRSLFGLE